jgi:hypothetical protein
VPPPRPPVRIEGVLDEPQRLHELARAHAPYWPVYRYFSGAAELGATGAPVDDPAAPMRVPPWFRGDWAHHKPLVPGIEPIFHSAAFRRAARQLYGLSDDAVIRQQLVYVNLMLPMPAADPGHTDVPAFRGIRRERHPVWLLSVMGHSGLFERWRIRIATAVSWWYEGEGGQFTCWPEGPDAEPLVLAPRSNTALVGENERMFHRVERVGAPGAELRLPELSPGAELHGAGDHWEVRDRGRALARVPAADVRISVSWKAEVFADPDEAHAVDAHVDDLELDAVWEIFARDLRRRGLDAEPGDAPLTDAGFITALGRAYVRTPTRLPRL